MMGRWSAQTALALPARINKFNLLQIYKTQCDAWINLIVYCNASHCAGKINFFIYKLRRRDDEKQAFRPDTLFRGGGEFY